MAAKTTHKAKLNGFGVSRSKGIKMSVTYTKNPG